MARNTDNKDSVTAIYSPSGDITNPYLKDNPDTNANPKVATRPQLFKWFITQ